MKTKINFVIESNGGYYITNRPAREERVVYSGTWLQCRRFIDPSF